MQASRRARRSDNKSDQQKNVTDDSAEEEDDDKQQQTPRRSLRSSPPINYDKPAPSSSFSGHISDEEDDFEHSSEDDAEQSGKTPVKTFEWPQISEVREEARRLAQVRKLVFTSTIKLTLLRPQTTRLSAPDVSDTFSSARDLLVQMHAFAAQTGFTMHRRKGSEDGSWVAIACSKGRSSRKHPKQGKCPCVVEAKRNAYGTYRVTKVVLRHNQTLDSPDNAPKPQSEPTPNFASISFFTPPAGPSSSQTTSLFGNLPLSLPQLGRFQFSTGPQLQPAYPSPLLVPAFLDDLKALISLLMPVLSPSSTSRLATTLIGTGVNSISDLANFLLFETDTTLPRFLKGLAHREGDDVAEDAFLFFQLMRRYSMDNA